MCVLARGRARVLDRLRVAVCAQSGVADSSATKSAFAVYMLAHSERHAQERDGTTCTEHSKTLCALHTVFSHTTARCSVCLWPCRTRQPLNCSLSAASLHITNRLNATKPVDSTFLARLKALARNRRLKSEAQRQAEKRALFAFKLQTQPPLFSAAKHGMERAAGKAELL
eukprot:2895557-Pleurochrysis_carterae.AAC.1